MNNIQSNSQESLTSKIRELSGNDITAKELVEDIKETCSKRSLDFNKVAEEIYDALQRAKDIKSVPAFCKGVLNKLATEKRALFEKKWKYPCFNTLHRAFKEANITGELWEQFLIDSVEEHCLNEFNVKVEEMVWTNRAIVTYCIANELRSYKDFLTLLLKSKLLSRCNVPIVVLTAQAKENAFKYESLIKDFVGGDLYGEN